MKLILAGNYVQARNYMLEHGLSNREAGYISSRESIMGIENPEVIRVGTWESRSDAAEIDQQVRLMTSR